MDFRFAPSPRARELSDQIAETIRGYRRAHPDLSGWDTRVALRLAARAEAHAAPPKLLILAAVVASLIGAGLGWFSEHPERRSLALVLATMAALIALMLVWRRRMSRE